MGQFSERKHICVVYYPTVEGGMKMGLSQKQIRFESAVASFKSHTSTDTFQAGKQRFVVLVIINNKSHHHEVNYLIQIACF